MNHTKEPWQYFEGTICSPHWSEPGIFQHREDAARAVACVNALAGIEEPSKLRRIELGRGLVGLFPDSVAFIPTPEDSERVTELVEAAKGA